MAVQENGVDKALQQIAELSAFETAIPIVVKQARFRGRVGEIALALTYPVKVFNGEKGTEETFRYPTIHNTNPTETNLSAWSRRAHEISGQLHPETIALSIFLNSLRIAKKDGPQPGISLLARAHQKVINLHETGNDADDKFGIALRDTAESFAMLWAAGKPDQFHDATALFTKQPPLSNLSGAPKMPGYLELRRRRISTVRDVISIFDTTTNNR